MKFEYRETQGGYLAELAYENQKEYFKTGVLENVLENVLEKELSSREKEIIQIISENSRITQNEISEKIGIAPQNIRKYITKLKQKGLLLRIGPDKGGYWEVNNNIDMHR